MKRQIKILFLALIFSGASLTSMVFAAQMEKTAVENPKSFKEYKDVVRILEDLETRSPYISLKKIGRTKRKKKTLYLVTIDDPAVPSKDKIKIMIVASIHGSEPSGMETSLRFIKEFTNGGNDNTKKYLNNCTFYIIPSMNPEGLNKGVRRYRTTMGYWDKTGRTNARGLDLNRDYQALRSRETRAAVKVYNEVRPDVVIDLHEYSATPLIIGSKGWWRGKYFDLLTGAGRHPDVYGPLSNYAKARAKDTIFPSLEKEGYRGGYYGKASGDFDSTGYMGVNGTDYFNLRGSLTFLLETAGYDYGLENFGKRIHCHTIVLNSLINRFITDKDEIRKLVKEAREYGKKRKKLTLKMASMPYPIEIEGKEVKSYMGVAGIKVDDKEYYSPVRIKFTTGDPDKRNYLELPDFYVVIPADRKTVLRLLRHDAKVYSSNKDVMIGKMRIPANTFVVPMNQEMSATIGFILDDESVKRNYFLPHDRTIVLRGYGKFEPWKFRRIMSKEEAQRSIEEFVKRLTGVKSK